MQSAEIQRIPNDTKELNLADSIRILNMIEKFEENDDVQQVFHNLSISSEIITELDK